MMQSPAGVGDLIYGEEVSSKRTEALFVALTSLCFLLLTWRVISGPLDLLAAVLFGFFACFYFYAVNYRTLIIRLTSESLKLKFGVFSWTVPLENAEACNLDVLPAVQRLGGAGIHFMSVHGRYRASFNFLEHPRIVVALKRRAGPVRDISFSTRRPQELQQLLRAAAVAAQAPR